MNHSSLTTQRPSECPCGGAAPNLRSGAKAPHFALCCGRFIDGGEAAPTALELMRSRYSAYVLGASDYLRVTWAPQTCPGHLDTNRGAPDAPRWLGLQIRRFAAQDETH